MMLPTREEKEVQRLLELADYYRGTSEEYVQRAQRACKHPDLTALTGPRSCTICGKRWAE